MINWWISRCISSVKNTSQLTSPSLPMLFSVINMVKVVGTLSMAANTTIMFTIQFPLATRNQPIRSLVSIVKSLVTPQSNAIRFLTIQTSHANQLLMLRKQLHLTHLHLSLNTSQPHFNVIGNKWVFHLKRNLDGLIARYKAWLVAKGFHQ